MQAGLYSHQDSSWPRGRYPLVKEKKLANADETLIIVCQEVQSFLYMRYHVDDLIVQRSS